MGASDVSDIDARVAVEVMGVRIVPDNERRSLKQRIYHRNLVPPYSTSITAAWEAVERMQEMGYAVLVYSHNGRWACEIEPEEGPVEGQVEDTAPLAICLAALAAVEGRG